MIRTTLIRRLTKQLGEDPIVNERPGYRNTYNWGTVWGTAPVDYTKITTLLGQPVAGSPTWGVSDPTGTQWAARWENGELCVY